MFTLTLLSILACMALSLARAVWGPTVFDRILAVNSFGTKTVLMIAVLGFLVERPEMLIDLALVYALVNFIGTVAVLKFTRFGDLAGMDNLPEPSDTDLDPDAVMDAAMGEEGAV